MTWTPKVQVSLQLQQHRLFVFTSSHQLALHEAIAQSLAGQKAVLQLLPLSIAELFAYRSDTLFGNEVDVVYKMEKN
jgi:predicted AAA+ superfamily ATPase